MDLWDRGVIVQKSLVKNSVFYMFYNLLNMLFPFITSIYVARILLPASVGEVAYAQNIVSYFSVLAFWVFRHMALER